VSCPLSLVLTRAYIAIRMIGKRTTKGPFWHDYSSLEKHLLINARVVLFAHPFWYELRVNDAASPVTEVRAVDLRRVVRWRTRAVWNTGPEARGGMSHLRSQTGPGEPARKIYNFFVGPSNPPPRFESMRASQACEDDVSAANKTGPHAPPASICMDLRSPAFRTPHLIVRRSDLWSADTALGAEFRYVGYLTTAV
jgi:hypothetical protein